MDRKQRHQTTVVSRLGGSGACQRFGTLFCLFIFAIQLTIPVAQIWHIAAEHVPAIALHDRGQSDPPETLRLQSESHRDGESDDGIYCPACQAFVYAPDVVDSHIQDATDCERSVCHLPLTWLTARESCLYASAPRAPPFSS